MQIHKIMGLVENRKAKRVVLLGHVNADPDAVCAAYAMAHLIKTLKPGLEVEVSSPQGPSRLSKFLLRSLPAKLTPAPRIEDAEVIVLLDTNTLEQLGEWSARVKSSHASLVVIDHHASHPETERFATLTVADEKASSASEIVYRLFKESGASLPHDVAKALFLGIAFDSRHFVLASSSTFKVVADLVDAGVRAEEALSSLSLPMEQSERIARLKASKRVRLLNVKGWLVAFSMVSAFQASAARGLISLGAHVAVVGGEKDGKIQVSLRGTQDFFDKTGVHLGRDIAKPMGEFLKGMGGGHSLSAGVNGAGDVESALKHCFQLLRDKLS